jgi:hypothetical protein
MIEKRLTRRILGPKRDEVAGAWRKLQNEELHKFYPSPNCDEIGRASSTNGEKRNAYRILVGNPEEKRPLERPRRRWVDNIKMYLRETGWGRMD